MVAESRARLEAAAFPGGPGGYVEHVRCTGCQRTHVLEESRCTFCSCGLVVCHSQARGSPFATGGLVPSPHFNELPLATIDDTAPTERSEPERLAGKVIAYRGWKLDGYKLGSANREQHGGFWNIGPNKAECRIAARRAFIGGSGLVTDKAPVGHDAPHPDCECGLYAYFDIRRENNPHNFHGLLWGAVAAWGDIEVHASGIRSEWAEPVVLGYDPQDPYEEVVRHQAIAGELGLSFVPFAELEAEALKHGQLVPESMRPEQPFLQFTEVTMSFEMNLKPLSATMREASEEMKKLAESVKPFAFTVEEMERIFSVPSQYRRPEVSTEKPARSKGVKATLKTSGPPFSGKWRHGDLVKDRKGDYWTCTVSGKPGSWERA